MARQIGDIITAADTNGIYNRMSNCGGLAVRHNVSSDVLGVISAGGYPYWYRRASGASESDYIKRPTGKTAPTYYTYPHGSSGVLYPDPSVLGVIEGGSSGAPVLRTVYSVDTEWFADAGGAASTPGGIFSEFHLAKFQTSGATQYHCDPFTGADSAIDAYYPLATAVRNLPAVNRVVSGHWWLGDDSYYYGIELWGVMRRWGMDEYQYYWALCRDGANKAGRLVLTKRSTSTNALSDVELLSEVPNDYHGVAYPTSNYAFNISFMLDAFSATTTYAAFEWRVETNEEDASSWPGHFMIVNYPAMSISLDIDTEGDYPRYQDGCYWIFCDEASDNIYRLLNIHDAYGESSWTMYRNDLADWYGGILMSCAWTHGIPDCAVGAFYTLHSASTGKDVYKLTYDGDTNTTSVSYQGRWLGSTSYTAPIVQGNIIYATDINTLRTAIENNHPGMFVSSTYVPLTLFTSRLYADAAEDVLLDDYDETLAASPTTWHGGDVSAGDVIMGYRYGDAYAVADYIFKLLSNTL